MNFEFFGNSHAATVPGAHPCGKCLPKQKQYPDGRGYTDVHPGLPFRSWFLGPITAFNFYENHYKAVKWYIGKHKDKLNNDTMYVFVVGEIDCRVHLPKQVVYKNRSVEDVTQECLERFFRIMLDMKKDGRKVAMLGAQPALSNAKLQELVKKDEWNIWFAGDEPLRYQICQSWENIARSLCKQHDMPYISIYEKLIDKTGAANYDLLNGDALHINHHKTISWWIDEMKVLNLLDPTTPVPNCAIKI